MIHNGLDLSEHYYNEYGAPMVEALFTKHAKRIAVGLVGEGSECFGLDDELSRDHDFGPSFCLWITGEDYNSIGHDLIEAYNRLPKKYLGFESLHESVYSQGRRGVHKIGDFYQNYIGFATAPTSIAQWRVIPENNLAVVCNGKVFADRLGEFSSIRTSLKAFYPEDLCLKKISARCAIMAQAGQYNYPRSIKRKAYTAANHALAQFVEKTISLVYLLNKTYTPYYKLMHQGMKNLPVLGLKVYELIKDLYDETHIYPEGVYEGRIEVINTICKEVADVLISQGLSSHSGDYLMDHGESVQGIIVDEYLKRLHIMAE